MAHTGFAQTLRTFNRFDTNLRKSLVKEVLPEHFSADYPSLIEFLEAYYEHLDSADNFGGIIEELQTVRDIEDAKLQYLDNMFYGVGLGVSQGRFTLPREAIRNFGNFFRVKGSEYSVAGFFRAFFGEDVEIIYPKAQLFTIGQSQLGPQYAYKLQNGRLYQVFSLLFKVAIPLSDWEALYRKYVHPSGFYLAAAVVIEGKGQVEIGTAESIADPRANITNVYAVASLNGVSEGEVVGAVGVAPAINAPLFDGRDSDQVNVNAIPYITSGYVTPGYMSKLGGNHALFRTRDRYSVYRNIQDFQNLTIAQVEQYYSNMYEWAGFYQSFDDYADSAGAPAIRFSSTLDNFSSRVYFRK